MLTWRIWWAPNNASRWQIRFNSEFKGLKRPNRLWDQHNSLPAEYRESFVGPNDARAWRLFKLWKRGATSPLPPLVSITFIHCAICGARGGAVGWGTALQVGRSRVRFPMVTLDFFHWHNPSGRTMALGSTQPLTEMSSRNVSWR